MERLDCRVLVAAPECFLRAFPLNTLHVRLPCSAAAHAAGPKELWGFAPAAPFSNCGVRLEPARHGSVISNVPT